MSSKFAHGSGVAKASPEDKIALSRDYVSREAAYFSKILYGLRFVPVPGIGTFATTPTLVTGYDPAYVEANMPDVLAGDIAHEIMHVLMEHFTRLSWCKDKKLANIAADLAINPDLRNAKKAGKPVWKLHPTFVFPEHFDLPEGKTAEQYYKLLEDQKRKAGGGSNGGKAKQPEEKSNGAGQGGEPDPNEGPPAGERVGAGSCGGVANGVDPPGLAEVSGRSDVEVTALVMQTAKAIKDHAKAYGRGSVPGSLMGALSADRRRSKYNWRGALSSILRDCTGRIQSGGDDFSISRPSKRSFVRGIIRPGLIENLPIVAFVLDTSGSMGSRQIMEALTHVIAIFEALGIDEVWFAEADAAVAMNFRVVNMGFFQNLAIAGRGGTNFCPAFWAAQKLNPRPELIVYFTDGDGGAPAAPPPGMETVWCIVPSYFNRRPAGWGHAVFINDDPRRTLEPPYGAP